MKSMTGYGKAEYIENGLSLTIEIKTVNNRNFDFNVKMPRFFLSLEDKIRKVVATKVIRGRIDLFINFVDLRVKPVQYDLNIEKAREYFRISKALSEEFGLNNDCTPSMLMRMPEVITDNTVSNVEEFEEIVIKTVNNACDNLNKMRNEEGKKLVSDMLKRVDDIAELKNKIEKRAPLVAEEFRHRLSERMAVILSGVEIDQARLLNEAAVYADKVNIDEELTRLSSHIAQFKAITACDGEGKKLDFLMQEFNRETNTICSKSNDIEVTKLALSMKNEIEKIREQVQNIE